MSVWYVLEVCAGAVLGMFVTLVCWWLIIGHDDG